MSARGWYRGGALLLGLAMLGLLAPGSASAGPTAKLKTATAPPGQLQPVGAVTLPGGTTIYRFQQEVGGVPVLDAQAIVADQAGAPPELAADSTVPKAPAPGPATVSRARAIAIAKRHADVRRLSGRPTAQLAIGPDVGGALVWRVTLPSRRPLADFESLVDAGSAAVLSQRNLIQSFQTGHAMLYDPNPVVEQGSYVGLGSDQADANTLRLNELRLPVDLPRLVDGQSCLTGQWAKAMLYASRQEVCDPGLDWTQIKRANDRFEALMAYYHVDRGEAYIQSLGFTNIQDRRQILLADSFSADNSFYQPSDRTIRYGTGGVDDAEDADVILHEYGHSIQDDQVPGFGASFAAGSMGEGFGDYWAAAMSTQSPGPPATSWDVCIFDWDGISYTNHTPHCGRRADSTMTKQQALASSSCSQDVHCVGTVWSSALWDLREALGDDDQGRSIMDRVVLASHFRLTPKASFADGGHALLHADEDLYPAGAPGDGQGAHYSAIRAEMQARGIL